MNCATLGCRVQSNTLQKAAECGLYFFYFPGIDANVQLTTQQAQQPACVVRLSGAGNVLDSPDILAETDILWLGGVAAHGTYEVLPSRRVDIGRVASCNVAMTVTGYGESIYDNFLSLTDVLNVTDLLGAALGPAVGIQPQLRTAGEDGVYGEWQNYVPGIYHARRFEPRVVLTSSDPQITAVMSGFRFSVDVPDRTETGTNVPIPAGGLTIAFSTPFNGGPDSLLEPHVHVSILNAQQGDYLVMGAATLQGFTVQVKNSGAGVARNINWFADGY